MLEKPATKNYTIELGLLGTVRDKKTAKATITLSKGYKIILSFSNSITGCGLMLMYGVSGFYCPKDLTDDDYKSVRQLIKEVANTIEPKHATAYYIVATVGPHHKESGVMALEKLGFKKMDEFINESHGKNHKQLIYSIHVKDL